MRLKLILLHADLYLVFVTCSPQILINYAKIALFESLCFVSDPQYLRLAMRATFERTRFSMNC